MVIFEGAKTHLIFIQEVAVKCKTIEIFFQLDIESFLELRLFEIAKVIVILLLIEE